MKEKKRSKKNKNLYRDRDDISWFAESKSLSSETADEIELEKLGDLKMISIRIPENIIERYKKKASKLGLAYQPYIRSLLIQWASITKE